MKTRPGVSVAPVLFLGRHDCCGCAACAAVCPSTAIAMIADEEGFSYPAIDGAACIGCLRCLDVCPFKRSFVQCGDLPAESSGADDYAEGTLP